MQTIEVYALAGALTTGMLSVLHFLVWRRQRESWSGYFALSYLLIGVVYAFDQQLQPVGDRSNLVARTIAVPAVLLFTLGLVQYVGVPQRAARHIAWGASTMALALLVMGHTGSVGRLGMFTGFAGFLTFHGLLALWAMRREPGRGHSLVFLAMMLYPAVLVAAWRGLIDVALLRYAVIVPMVVSGTTLLTTGLLRAQQQAADELARRQQAEAALQSLNDTLEQMRQAQPEAADLPVHVGELPTVEADPGLLRQVYVNLLGNALKFSREGAAPQVEVGAFERDGEQVCFVRDNGVGFDAAEAERLFQPFQRLHGQRFPGHGVGLSIVKRIVERHGGRLWAQAQRQQGATFYFSLPPSRH